MVLSVILSVVVIGLSGMTAQILLLRELFVSFLGNELTFGIVLGEWILSEALGSWWGRKKKWELQDFIRLQILFCASLFLGLLLSRDLKAAVFDPWRVGGCSEILLISFPSVFLPAFLHGALFPACCALMTQRAKEGVGRAYIWETLGTVIGAVTAGFFLLRVLNPMQIVLLLCALHLGVCASLDRERAVPYLILFCLCGPSAMLFAPSFERLSLKWRFPGYDILENKNSPYGNLSVLQREGELSFLFNGKPFVSLPHYDPWIELPMHLPLLVHPDPKEVLLIGSGLGGRIYELLKHPVEEIDYAELDPEIISLFRRHPTPLTSQELNDPRVRLRNMDGRKWLMTSKDRYDVILISLGFPSDLQTNRLFTLEAFQIMKDRLRDGGILSMELEGSSVYLGDELKGMLCTLISTLRRVLPYIKVIPGEMTLIMASRRPLETPPELLKKRLKGRKIQTHLLTPQMIHYLLSPEREGWFLGEVTPNCPANRDLRPLLVYRTLSFEGALYDPELKAFLSRFKPCDKRTIWILTSALLFATMSLLPRRRGMLIAIGVTGFYGMTGELIVIYMFQTAFGYVYLWIGLLLSAFMLGAALGAFWGQRVRIKRGFTISEGAMALFAPLLGLLLGTNPPAGVYLLLSGILGGFAGWQFCRAASIQEGRASRIGGTLYFSDLLGGLVGSLLSGVLLLPLWGIKDCLVLMGIIKGVSFLGLSLRS